MYGSFYLSWINLISIHMFVHIFFSFYKPSLNFIFSPRILSKKNKIKKQKKLLKYLLTLAICSSQSPIYSSQLSHLVSANHHAMVLLLLKSLECKINGQFCAFVLLRSVYSTQQD